jgi:hypothetical protein
MHYMSAMGLMSEVGLVIQADTAACATIADV